MALAEVFGVSGVLQREIEELGGGRNLTKYR